MYQIGDEILLTVISEDLATAHEAESPDKDTCEVCIMAQAILRQLGTYSVQVDRETCEFETDGKTNGQTVICRNEREAKNLIISYDNNLLFPGFFPKTVALTVIATTQP